MVNIAVHFYNFLFGVLVVVKLLAIDRGNSRTKVGLHHKNGDVEMAVFANTAEDELIYHIKSLQFDAAIMSSVAVENLNIVSEYLQLNGKFICVDSSTPLPLISEYATPETLGVDRIAGAIGAWKLVGNKNVLLIDVGTCINYECVVNNIYLGGAISPGLEMRLKAMHDYTGKLPLLKLPEIEIEIIGNSTSSCMLSGAIYGMVNEIEGIVNRYQTKYSGILVVLSGGDGLFLGKYLKNSIFAQHKEVVLLGLIEILKYNLND